MVNFQECPCAGKNMSNLAAPWILLALFNHQGTHGYEIKKIIKSYMEDLEIGFNITGLYRHLNMLEKRGMLFSKWDIQNKGPAKRKYYLNEAGKECLWHWMQTLSIQVSLIGRFFEKAKSAFPSAPLPEIQFKPSVKF
jgi:DNA-binding PadR family transcriptional regulator